MLELAEGKTTLGHRIKSYIECRSRFRELVELLDMSSVHTPVRKIYDEWMKR